MVDANNLNDAVTDWSKSYFGLSTQAFSKDIVDILLAPVDPLDVEMKPGGWAFPYCVFLFVVYDGNRWIDISP
jgi:Mitochondrial genome maintenance MGM101